MAISATFLIASLYFFIRVLSLAGGFEIDRFEDANIWVRFSLPFLGFVILIVLAKVLDVDGREVGGTYTLRRVINHQGVFPWRNGVMQFLSAAVALASGYSGGKDGPSLHLGAWVAYILRKRLNLRKTDLGLLLRVGMTAAIAAGFHTPFAAVLFVVAVVPTDSRPRRSIGSLLILGGTALFATFLSTWFGVSQLEGGLQVHDLFSPFEWLSVIVFAMPMLAVGIGTMKLVIEFSKVKLTFPVRMLAIAFLTGILALFLPEVLGMGFDTFNGLQHGQINASIDFLLFFVAVKLLLTSISVAFGVPVGVIAPALVNGGALGALCYTCLILVVPDWVSAPISVYVLFGAVALLGLVFNNPLAAIVMFLEMTLNLWLTLQIAVAVFLAHECKIRTWGDLSIFEARLAVLEPQAPPQPKEN